MTFDFNTAEPQAPGTGQLIPDNTILTAIATLRPGGHGPDGWLKTNRDGSCLMADFEFTITGPTHAKRKIWSNYVVVGETEGQLKAVQISRTALRSMLESAYGIDPKDDTPAAQAKRAVTGYQAFDGLAICIKVGIEKGGLKDKMDPYAGSYDDKNRIKAFMTPADPGYIKPEQPMQSTPGQTGVAQRSPVGSPSSTAAAATKPGWAS